MRELARSLLRLPWEMSRQGMEQLESILAPDSQGSPIARARKSLDAALTAAEDELDRRVLDAVQAVEGLPEDFWGPLAASATRPPMTGATVKQGIDWTQQTAQWLASMPLDEAARLALREFDNRLQSFGTFRYVDALLGIGPQDPRRLATRIAAARRLDPYTAVWAIEGLGHHWAQHRPSPDGAGLLADEPGLPADALIALHAGMGLVLARDALAPAAANPTDAGAVGAALDDFARRCRRAARPGYEGVALEACGLVGRTLYPQLVAPVDRALEASDPELLAYFWHGMGRGAYFLPTHFIPGHRGAGRAVDLLLREAPHSLGQRNALAGLAWPLVLVNVRHPEVAEAFLGRHGEDLAGRSFGDGVGAALAAWRDLTGDGSYNRMWLEHEPDPGDRDLVQWWDTQIRTPCKAAEDCYAAARAHGAFGELFRHHPLEDLEEALKQAAPRAPTPQSPASGPPDAPAPGPRRS